MVIERLQVIRGVEVHAARAVEATKAAAGGEVEVDAIAETAKDIPRVLIVLAIIDPVVLLDVLGEVADVLVRHTDDGALDALDAVVVVVAANRRLVLVDAIGFRTVVVAVVDSADVVKGLRQLLRASTRHRAHRQRALAVARLRLCVNRQRLRGVSQRQWHR